MIRSVIAAALALGLLPGAAAADGSLDPSLRELFDLWDGNGDGVINGDEYRAGGDAPRHYDPDKDGTLTLKEYAAYHARTPDGSDAAGAVPVPAAAAPDQGRAAELPAELPAGEYACMHIYYDFLNKRTMNDHMGKLTLGGDGSYRWFDGEPGRYVYDGRSGGVAWIGGAFAELAVRDSGLEWKGDDLMLWIEFEQSSGRTLRYNCHADD